MLPISLRERYFAEGFLSGYKTAKGYEKGFPDTDTLEKLFEIIEQKIDTGDFSIGVAIGIADILRGPLWDLTVNSDAPENALYKIAALHLNAYIDMSNDLQNDMKNTARNQEQ